MTIAASTRAEVAPRLPLDGIKIVEFTHMVMGPTCGLVHADLGAEVVKVEPAPEGARMCNPASMRTTRC